jgi:cysteine desulfurase
MHKYNPFAKNVKTSTIYLDHNATSPMYEEVKNEMLAAMEMPLNPSSMHQYGKRAKGMLEDARAHIASALGLSKRFEIVFTSCGTEANNLAINGLRKHYAPIASNAEHVSVLNAVGKGEISVSSDGLISLAALDELCKRQEKPFLISVMLANNETGAIQPVAQIVQTVHRYGGIVHTDATQALGKIPLNFEELNADLITLSAHKIGGPLGVGALVMKKDLPLEPILWGGGQEFRYRSGTQNTPAICGFSTAVELALRNLDKYQKLTTLRDHVEQQIHFISPHSIFFSQSVDRLPNTSSFTMPNVLSETQVIHFDLCGIAVSAGSACSSGKAALPHVQMSMGYSEEIARTSLRISLGLGSSKADLENFIQAWKQLYYNSNSINSFGEVTCKS